MRDDPYEVLGLRRGATEEDIRSAYRARARQLHPDASGDPETAAAFNDATEAYDQLREICAEGEPVPVRYQAPRPQVPELPCSGRGAPRRPVEAEPMLRRDPGAEPLRSPRSARVRPAGPLATPRSLVWELEPLLWLLGADYFDLDD